ncbi:MAG: iron ABC transporter permease [Verrucomicrobiales bacterium]|nr:iron ABC transporter permease [Verrucomicrobiales bacterium]
MELAESNKAARSYPAVRNRSWRKLKSPDSWGISVGVFTALICLPIFAVLIHLTKEGPEWAHLVETVLPRYLINTAVLVVGVTAAALLMGVLPAWLVTVNNFPGRGLFCWMLILPLALPSYVAAFVFYQGPEAAIPLLIWIRTNISVDAFLKTELVIRYGLLILMMSAVLYPYIYLACRAAFSQQGRTLIESARCLGDRPGAVFFRVAIPLARPAMVAGSALVIMEVINDYGAVHFFGVPTLTEGIFRTWFGMGDKVSALRLAGIVMLAVAALLIVEQLLRGKARYVEAEGSSIPLVRKTLSGGRAAAAFLCCLIPLTIGFLYPVGRLVHWSWLNLTSDRGVSLTFGDSLVRGLVLAGATALVVTLLASFFAFAVRLRENPVRKSCFRLSTLGYATPGAVIAVGVLVVFGGLDRLEIRWIPLFSGSLFLIGFAYLVRFIAIPLQLSRAGMDRLGPSLGEASRLLGWAPFTTFLRIDLPLLKGPLLAAAMLLFVDILKELPLTLILRPANFETLATSAFSLAKEARLQACAVPSLMIVAAGAVGLLIMNRWLAPTNSHE